MPLHPQFFSGTPGSRIAISMLPAPHLRKSKPNAIFLLLLDLCQPLTLFICFWSVFLPSPLFHSRWGQRRDASHSIWNIVSSQLTRHRTWKSKVRFRVAEGMNRWLCLFKGRNCRFWSSNRVVGISHNRNQQFWWVHYCTRAHFRVLDLDGSLRWHSWWGMLYRFVWKCWWSLQPPSSDFFSCSTAADRPPRSITSIFLGCGLRDRKPSHRCRSDLGGWTCWWAIFISELPRPWRGLLALFSTHRVFYFDPPPNKPRRNCLHRVFRWLRVPPITFSQNS